MENTILSARLAPPGARLAPARPPVPAAPAPAGDRFEASEPSSAPLTWGKRAALAGLGMMALAGPAFAQAGPAGAAAAPVASQAMQLPAPPVTRKPFSLAAPTDTVPPPPPAPKDTSQVGTRIEAHFVNDSFRDYIGAGRSRDYVPGTEHGDDNGWTHESRISVVRTEGDRQTVSGLRLQMVTERGSWEPVPGYGARRTDIWEVSHQYNFRERLDERTDLLYGAGLGVQAVGNLGGRHIQEWFHDNISGGRIGEAGGLQTNYSTDNPTFAPLITGGAGLRYRLDDHGDWHLKNSVEGALPLGPGLAALRAGSSLEYRASDRLSLEAGAGVTASWAQGPALNFIDTDGVRPTAWVGGEYRLTKHASAFARADYGGIRDEPVYRVGITIHFGGGKAEKAWLDPLWP